MIRLLFTAISFTLLISCQPSLPPIDETYSAAIRLNQVGFYPKGPKKVILADASDASEFIVVNLEDMKAVHTGQLSERTSWELSGEGIQVGDFSTVTAVGNYAVYVEGLGYSYPFQIGEKVLREAFLGSVKALYYQRASFELEEKYAGKWSRKMGHPDDDVAFHPSSGKTGSKASPGGWYDAGDFGKYVVNGAFPLGQLFAFYEQYPEAIQDGDLNIPESGNGIGDLLDELKYEMDWLLTMQDDDGGMFFKLTTERFEAMVLPELAVSQRYIIGKGTTAALDFAAVAAKANRAFLTIDPAYAERCLSAAKRAWDWAQDNPGMSFKNPEGIVTGQYGDENFDQEFYWAAAELYASTKEQEYLDYIKQNPIDFAFSPNESWANFMHYLGAFTLIQHDDEEISSSIKDKIKKAADDLVSKAQKNAYFQPIEDFHWGSNSDVLNSAMIIAQAYRMDSNPIYLQTVQEIMDYILGKNAMGYSFMTGFGDHPAMFIHHRQSAGDDIEDPVPGLLSGGPNYKKQDSSGVNYPENAPPMKSWVDEEPSYASNEICLNWNAPLTYVLGFIEQEQGK